MTLPNNKDKFTNHKCKLEDGDTRTSYNGICPDEQFLINLLNNIR